MTLTVLKEHELMSYEALSVIDGLFFKFTYVKLKGPNKSIKSSSIPGCLLRDWNGRP